MNSIILKKNLKKKNDLPHFIVQTDDNDEGVQKHIKVIWDNKSESAEIPHIKVVWDNECPGKVKIEVDGEEKSLKDIHKI